MKLNYYKTLINLEVLLILHPKNLMCLCLFILNRKYFLLYWYKAKDFSNYFDLEFRYNIIF